MDFPYERVYTVSDYWDGPRSGFADFDGRPHAYRSVWRPDLDDWDPDGGFVLHAVSGELLALALEDWAIWRRWEEAFYAGAVGIETHPALPADCARHEQLAPVVSQALEFDESQGLKARGRFRARGGIFRPEGQPTSHVEVEVAWTPLDRAAAV